MAESGEAGLGRLAEPAAILAAIEAHFAAGTGPLAGKRAIVTSGPTHEPIDPVRYLANRSSGRQGHAIAAALAQAGAEVTLVSGPVEIAAARRRAHWSRSTTAREMQEAVEAALPADIAVMAAAVADWRVEPSAEKIKKDGGGAACADARRKSRHPRRPRAAHEAPAPRRRLRGGDGEPPRQRRRAKLQRKGVRLDRRQRRVAGDRHHGRHAKPRAPRHRRRASRTGRRCRRTRWRRGSSSGSPSTL